MKRFISILVLAVAVTGFSADVLIPLSQLGISPATNRSVLIKSEWLNPTNTIGLPNAFIARTGTNTSVTVSNVPEAILNIEVMAPPNRLAFSIYVPETNVTLNAADLRGVGTGGRLDPNRYSWSVRASDARYARAGSVGGATNVVLDGATNVNLGGVFRYPAKADMGSIPLTQSVEGWPALRYPNGTIFAIAVSYYAGPSFEPRVDLYLPGSNVKFWDGVAGKLQIPEGLYGYDGRPLIEYDYDSEEYIYSGNGRGLTDISIVLTNSAGAAFRVLVNSSTNGLIFIPQ